MTPSIDREIAEIEDEFAFLSDWEERFRHIIDLGRALPPLPDALKTEAARVRGCASQVWLVSSPEADGGLVFRGDSDAHIVKGLVALMLRVFSGRTPREILGVDPNALMARLGLAEALTPQRSNGLAALVARIRREAEAAG